MSHTPGKWTVSGEDGYATVVSNKGLIIAETSHIHEVGNDLGESMHLANMRLIAAAPELLAALKLCVEWIPCAEVRSWPPGHKLRVEALKAARAAILKAEGSQ